MSGVVATVEEKPAKGWRLLIDAFKNRKTGVMLIFGFAAGLPYTLLLGTLNAWLGEAKVSLATIGILSWIGLAYAFKFLWSPVVDKVRPPLLARLGRRRSWLFFCQIILAGVFMALAGTDPVLAIGSFALVAVVGAFVSATQDVVIDAWRIDVADETATLELLSTVYQLGYRISALVGGALALIFAARVSWPVVYGVMGIVMALTVVATLMAPDTDNSDAAQVGRIKALVDSVPERARNIALIIVGLGWGWAIATIGSFMIAILMADPNAPDKPVAGDFIKFTGPWIVAATVVLPAIVAAWLNSLAQVEGEAAHQDTLLERFADHSYAALILPLKELIGRLGWSALVVLGLILSYRICDSVWGPFAFPFYLQELQYTNDEVAFASKIFGVMMTIAGVAAGGLLFVWLGRMPTLLIGAIVAALSNLLYADLAMGAPVIDAFCNLTGLSTLMGSFGVDARMLRLLVAISGENIAGGLAGAAFVAYLSSITSKEFSAVQYALLSSLTFLVGSLGRGAIGEAIEDIGYAPVFQFTAVIGVVAIAFCLLEWGRQARNERLSLA